MGRFGNQVEHFLGAMSFAKQLNRTLVVPPFRTYKNIPYNQWFKIEKLGEFHRVISAEDFMQQIAPKYWPTDQRFGFCWLPKNMINEVSDCKMKDGYPSEPFWTELGVEKFTTSIIFHDFGMYDYDRWKIEYPPEKYPVIAMKGAPASFPMRKHDRLNQQYMELSDFMNDQVSNYIREKFSDRKFIGLHFRNGQDWSNACKHAEGMMVYMASPQCLDTINKSVKTSLCFPTKEIILKDLENLLINQLNRTIKDVYIATDKDPMLNDIKSHFSGILQDLNLVHQDPWLPLVDAVILAKSDYFIGNCVSSFTSYVKRERDIKHRPSNFWAFDFLYSNI
jgi:peptide-O-fucosyltransferase